MNNFDLESKKYMIILLAIFLAFALVVIKAFDYIPDEPQDGANIKQEQVLNVQEKPIKQKYTEEQEEQPEQTKKRGLNVDLRNHVDIIPEESAPLKVSQPMELETIEPVNENSNNLSSEQQLELKLLEVQKLVDTKQYVKALEEYKSIAESVSDTHTKARCYEEMANIYGIVKRYGTALSYAQKAYNTEPTSNREMLLARLYYKTGDLDKATKRMNNVLQREFSEDRG